MPVLFAFREDRFGFRYEIGERALLGRSPDCDLILFDRATSRFHAEISRLDGGYVLKDLGSTNGTLHNEVPVKDAVPLKQNDEIRVGQEIFLFDPDLDVAVGRDGAVLMVGSVDGGPSGLVAHPAKPDYSAVDRTALAVLTKMASTLNDRPKVPRILKQSAYVLEKVLGATHMALLWPESSAAERLTALLVRHPERRVVLPAPLTDRVLKERQAVLWPSVLTSLSFAKGERKLFSEDRPSLTVPVIGGGERRGLLYVDSQTRTFIDRDLHFLIILADLISSALTNAYQAAQLDHRLTCEERDLNSGGAFVGAASETTALLATAAQVAQTDDRIFLLGELGTGKTVLAKRIHALSRRRRAPFVMVNCAALAPTQIESVLFGQEAGGISDEAIPGVLEDADGGTIFMKNVDHLPLSVQVELLRTFEEGVIYRVGSSRPRPINIRTIAATNVDLEPLVQNKEFREDLYHRLSEVNLTLPPLRELRDDIIVLAKHFLTQQARSRGLPVPELDPACVDCLLAYPWPGNVGELENVVERLVMFSTGGRIVLDDLPMDLRLASEAFQTPAGDRVPDNLIEVEKSLIRRVLARSRGSSERAARVLGLGTTQFGQFVQRYDITLPHRHGETESETNE